MSERWDRDLRSRGEVKRLSRGGSVSKWVRGRGEWCLIGASVFCGELTVLIMKCDGLGERWWWV